MLFLAPLNKKRVTGAAPIIPRKYRKIESMKIVKFALLLAGTGFLMACGGGAEPAKEQEKTPEAHAEKAADAEFEFFSEQFADIKVLRYNLPGFEELTAQQKELLYYLYEAAISGRDMMYDQNYKHNLCIRKTLEAVYTNYAGDKNSEEFKSFHMFLKRVWFSNGIHHHYSNDKMMPEFSQAWFEEAVNGLEDAALPLSEGEDKAALIAKLSPILFDASVANKKVNIAKDVDKVMGSAVNFYEGVTEAEAIAYYADNFDNSQEQKPEYGLNTKLMKVDGKIVEKTWKVGGMYTEAIEKVVYWLEKAVTVAENDVQKAALDALVTYYKSGDVADWDAYNIKWVADTDSPIDVVNGFIEVYNDPLGRKGSFESVVSVRDPEASKRIAAIGEEAQWFEDNSSIMDEHKKPDVKGISAKVISVIMEAGDASPSTPIGINLPNNNWVRETHGSKSVNLGNIVNAYDEASRGTGFLDEFTFSQAEVDRLKKHGSLADKLHTDMHEVIGHASGKINKGIGTPAETMGSYASTLEEARADLVALYFMIDQKLIDMGVMPSMEVGYAAYDDYIRNGMLSQLVRIKPGKDIEEAHMRNRQLVCHWVYERGEADKVVERVTRDGKTFFVVNDYEKLRVLFGDLLREIQRLKSEGDTEAGLALVEDYGVKVDQELHAEVLERYEKLGVAPYSGFINPKVVATMDGDKVVEVNIEYPDNFTEQMLEYGRTRSFLPTYN